MIFALRYLFYFPDDSSSETLKKKSQEYKELLQKRKSFRDKFGE